MEVRSSARVPAISNNTQGQFKEENIDAVIFRYAREGFFFLLITLNRDSNPRRTDARTSRFPGRPTPSPAFFPALPSYPRPATPVPSVLTRAMELRHATAGQSDGHVTCSCGMPYFFFFNEIKRGG